MSRRIHNWSEYGAGLTLRGSVTGWRDEEAICQWSATDPITGNQRRAPRTYSDLATATIETLKSVYGLAGCQTAGFLQSLFHIMQVPLSLSTGTKN